MTDKEKKVKELQDRIQNHISMKLLKSIPQKDGSITKYLCGLTLVGGWSTRLKAHKEFITSKMGAYILKLENQDRGTIDSY